MDLSISAKTGSQKQVALYEQALADKRLNYEMGRLKACAEALRGIRLQARLAVLPHLCRCRSQAQDLIQDHTHEIIYPKPASDREWLDSGDAGSRAAPVRIPVSPYGQASD